MPVAARRYESRLCSSGCHRLASAATDRCCKSCQGSDGPHEADCTEEVEQSQTPKHKNAFAGKLPEGCTAVLRVLEARLFRSFDKLGKMDPFACIEWHLSDGRVLDIGRTKSAWGEHLKPQWNHTCRPVSYRGSGSGDSVSIKVFEENLGGYAKATFCGEVTANVDLLLSEVRMEDSGNLFTQPQSLTLVKKDEDTGTVTVQLLIQRPSVGGQKEGEFTTVDPSLFVMPVKRIAVSGGTAPFFTLILKDPPAHMSKTYWIGKDLSRAMDELSFYEGIREMSVSKAEPGMQEILKFMFEYAGVLECAEDGGSSEKLQLLVLRNLRDQRGSLRMLDIKIGEKTAAAGWKGKSRLACYRQGLVDGFTNSQAEGFRLEGFDGANPALMSMDPLLDVSGLKTLSSAGDALVNAKYRKKVFRIMLQRMSAVEMFMHFLDLHIDPQNSVAHSERAEIVLDEICKRLITLAVACRRVPVPQKWIGSSVALGFDAQKLILDREYDEEELRETVVVQIFDWGRSELNTVALHSALKAADQADRMKFWQLYVGGIDRLAWQAARAYRHRFCCEWEFVELAVFDFDSTTADDFIGKVFVNLEETEDALDPGEEMTMPLVNKKGDQISGKGGKATITFSVSWSVLSSSSRLSGIWQVRVTGAKNLPACDGLAGSSDPYVRLIASAQGSDASFEQRSSVKVKELNPVWNETFELPVLKDELSKPEVYLRSNMASEIPAGELLPSAISCSDNQEDQALKLWDKFLCQACGRHARSWLC